MSYIGKEPQVGAYNMLDSLTASATADYSLTLDSTAFVPESANHLLVSLNGVIQKAGSSFTVSGSTLSFSSALTSSDSIDFVLALGNVLDIGTPSDGTVTNAKTNFVSTSSAAGLQIKGDGTTDGTLQLNCSQNSHGIKLRSPAHSAAASYTLTFPTTDGNASEFLQTDGSGTLTWAAAGGNSPAFEAINDTNQSMSNNTYTKVTFGTENLDTDSCFASSRFTPTTAGKYFVYSTLTIQGGTNVGIAGHIQIRKNGGSVFLSQTNVYSNNDMNIFSVSASSILTLNGSSDYVEIYGLGENSSGTPDILGNANGKSIFGGFLLGGV